MSDTPAEGASGVRAREGTFGEVSSAPTQKYCSKCGTRHPSHYKLCPNDGTLLVDADDLVGTTLSDSYVVIKILGEGGMGRVYEARHTRLESKRFAIKTLHEDLAHHQQTVARFRREADVAAAIESPYVVTVYDVDETADGRLYLVSELLEGAELGAYLAEHKKLSVALAVRIVRQITKALDAAHRAGAVHRDLKPENVFLTGDPSAPVAKVLDFGIAKFDDQTGKALTKTGMVMGTPAYMSPEQANGQKVDHRTDIYAAGAILYACLTGHAPFEGEDPGGVLIQVMTREPPPPRSHDSSIPVELELVIQRAMSPERDDRYQHAHELDAALAPFDASDEALAEGMSFELSPYSQRSAPTLLRRGEDAERRTQRAERARRELDLLWMAGLAWLGLGLVAAVGGILRLARGGNLSAGQSVALALGAIALGVPGYLVVRRTRARLGTDDAITLADRLRGPIVAAVAVYGLATLILRFSEMVIARSAGASWPGWDVLLWLASAIAAAVVALPEFFERRGSRAAEVAIPLLERPALTALIVVGLLVSLFGLLPAVHGSSPGGGGDAPVAVRVMQEVRALEDALAKGELETAAAHLAELAETDGAASTVDVQKAAMELASKSALQGGPVADRVFELLSEDMDSAGIDVLYRLHTEKGGSKAADRATSLLGEEEVRARGSPALRIAYDLRHAQNCEALVALLDRAEKEGDERALGELTNVLSCANRDRCCLQGDARVTGAVNGIKKRIN
jgi:serine/threonine-protein kinase